MKKNLFRFYLLSFFLLTDFIMFAQPGDDDDNGGLEDDDPPATPINGKLIWLLILGTLYAIYAIQKHRAVKRLNSNTNN